MGSRKMGFEEMKFSFSEITQGMVLKKKSGSGECILKGLSGDGYLRSLKRSYMKEIREYLEKFHADQTERCQRFLILAPNEKLARQGYLVLRQGLLHLVEQDEDEEDEYAAFYREKKWYAKSEESSAREVLLLPGEAPQMSNGPLIQGGNFTFMLTPFKEAVSDKEERTEKMESVLVEIGNVKNPDAAAERVMELDNAWIGVYLKPSGSYQYLVKQLAFEGGFQVLSVGEPSSQDYIDYAMEYLDFHHFRARVEDVAGMLKELKSYRGERMEEQDIYLHLSRCLKKALDQGSRSLSAEDIAVVYPGQNHSAKEEFDKVVGLDEIKNMLNRRLYAIRILGDHAQQLHSAFIMEGEPGTGKSMMARLFAGLMGEMGISNGRFVDATRADIIGKYVGHTAANVRAVFEKAEGGVLFVDEASYLLGSDDFVQEAVIEFVRYMELYPQTTVIFATYPEEGRKLLDCDPGFRSRIHQIISFPNYSDEEFVRILEVMAKRYGFSTTPECGEKLTSYLQKIKTNKHFGNAREVRRLLETAIEEFGIRAEETDKREITAMDIGNAAEYLLHGEKRTDRFGFSLAEET